MPSSDNTFGALTPAQRTIVEAVEGTTVVMAAVGSGKTTTLTARIQAALAQGVPPHRVLALTFTNRAAMQMRESLRRTAGAAASQVQLRTFHGLCAWILRSEAPTAGLPSDFWIFDEEDSQDLLRELKDPKPADSLYKMQADASGMVHTTTKLWYSGRFSSHPLTPAYVRGLTERGAVDYSGLVLLTRAVFTQESCRRRWSNRFDVVCVDELQDTHLSEYEVVRTFAAGARSRLFVGDLDQSIYGWRGSRPELIIRRIAMDLGPVRQLTLEENFRATRQLLRFIDQVGRRMGARATKVRPHSSLTEGEAPTVTCHQTEDDEAREIATRCGATIAGGVEPTRIAVLTRTNAHAGTIAVQLAKCRVPHVEAEKFRFFRRAEVKDALALLSLVVQDNAEGALRRLALRCLPGVGIATYSHLLQEGGPLGLRLTDLLAGPAKNVWDPFWALHAPEIVVLDTETTGLDPDSNEVVEVAAVRVREGKESGSFTALLRPSAPVGDSEAVHGLSDALLAKEGRPPVQVYRRLAQFIGGTPVAGHNLPFDLTMLEAHSRRVGIPLTFTPGFDTLVLSRRLWSTPSYRLADLVAELGLKASPTHRALDDVRATIALAAALQEKTRGQSLQRTTLIRRYAGLFASLAQQVAAWRSLDLPPADLLVRVMADFGLREAFAREPERLANLNELQGRVARLQTPGGHGLRALREILERVALVRSVDLMDEERGVRVFTVHQAKGMEFDVVFVPGLMEKSFPSYQSVKDGDVEEERRLFYVAITRARRRLHLSWSRMNQRGWTAEKSRFLG